MKLGIDRDEQKLFFRCGTLYCHIALGREIGRYNYEHTRWISRRWICVRVNDWSRFINL